MKYAPAISSIISTEYLVEFVKERYDLINKTSTSCSIIRTGINHTYLIKDLQNQYILRIYYKNWRSESEILAELKLLDLLKENHISVSYPISDKTGRYLQSINAIEGQRFAVLFSYAQGQTIRNPSKEVCYRLGVEIAKMHQITLNKSIDRTNYNADSLVNSALQAAKNYFIEPSEEVQYLKKAYNAISNQFKNADLSQLRQGSVHLDLWCDNIKVKDDMTITMFDFDNCGNGWLFLDIGYSLMILFKNEPNKSNFQEKANSFRAGYQSITPISAEELRLAPYGALAIWLHYSGIHIQRFDDFSNPFFSKAFLKMWIQFGESWMDFNDLKM